MQQQAARQAILADHTEASALKVQDIEIVNVQVTAGSLGSGGTPVPGGTRRTVRMSLALAAHGLLLASGWPGARAKQPLRVRDALLTFLSAAVAMALGMTLILYAMRHGQAGLVAVLSSVTPILILPMLWLIYRRRPAVGAWSGAVLAVAGTALILR